MLERFRTDLRKEMRLMLRDRKALVVSGLIPVLVIWAYGAVEPPAEVHFDDTHFRTTDPTALVVSLSVMLPAFMLGSGAIVREKAAGTLHRLARTPMHSVEFVGAKLAVLSLVSLAQVLLVVTVATTTLENITVSDGSGFILRLGLTAIAFVSTGLFISSLAGSENQALALTTFGVLVMLVLCGFLAPLERLDAAEPLARALPYTHAYLATYYSLKGADAPEPFVFYLFLDLVATFALAVALVQLYRRR